MITTFSQEIEYGEFNYSESEYRSIKALNSSSIKLGKSSPLHIDKALDGTLKFKKAKHFTYGSEFHYMLFEPEKFNELYYISDQHLDLRRRESKPIILKEKIFSNGKNRIDAREGDSMKKAMESIRNHPDIRKLIETPGKVETNLVWKDKETGLNCKGRCDKIIHDNFIIDLKTTKDTASFKNEAKKFGYGIQAAFYTDGYKAIFGENTNIEFVFIVIDKEEPFKCDLFTVSQKTMKESIDLYKKYINDWINYKNDPAIIYDTKEI